MWLIGHPMVVAGGIAGMQGTAGLDFFVSHTSQDLAWAEWVAWHLVEAGYTVELDSWDWAVGENFIARMHRAVEARKPGGGAVLQSVFRGRPLYLRGVDLGVVTKRRRWTPVGAGTD
jgi:hypothetical protein